MKFTHTLRLLLLVFPFILPFRISAQKWLPRHYDPKKGIRLLGCHYDGARLKAYNEINPESEEWKASILPADTLDGTLYIFEAKKEMHDVGVAVAFDRYDWTSDNYIMVPSAVYNGNRQRIVNRQYATGLDNSDYYRRDLALTSNPIPQLSPEFGAPSCFELSVCNAATPMIACYERKKQSGTFLFTDQGTVWDGNIRDHALIVEESADRSVATFVISAPGVREKKPEFIGFSPSPDRGISVKPGDKIAIRVTEIRFFSPTLPEFMRRFLHERKQHHVTQSPRNLMPMSEVFTRMTRNIDERYFIGPEGSYYCPENADWMSYGWIGGLMNTYPMLALGDTLHTNRVIHTLDFGLSHGYGRSGYFYDVVGKDGKVLYRDGAKAHPGIGLTRRNADLLYWTVKQMMLMEKQGKATLVRPEWKDRVRALADAFVQTWQTEGTWGNYLDIEKGNIATYNTTGGAMAIGGLALASRYFHTPRYLEVARQAATYYYRQYALLGFTSGGCGDILQNADSETCAALMTSMMTLFECTGDTVYLDQSADVAALLSSWTVSFPYHLPASTPLYQLKANLTGAVWASTQNKHGAPGLCTQSGDALFKLYRYTGNREYAELLRDIIHAHTEGIQPNGKITERLTYCDADSRGSRGDGGKTGWNETNGALMSLEIPGIYVRKDKGEAYVFDHVEIKEIQSTRSGLLLTVHNPTPYTARVTILAEDKAQADKPLGENAFTDWRHRLEIKAGKTINVKIK